MTHKATHALGWIFYCFAVSLWSVFGFYGRPAVATVLAGSASFSVGYLVATFPKVVAAYKKDSKSILSVLVLLFVVTTLLGASIYGMGWAVSAVQ